MEQQPSPHLRPISDQPIFVTILSDVFLPGAVVALAKDEESEYDDEAIMVWDDVVSAGCCDAGAPCCTVGRPIFVANSTKTVARGTYSAGRLYDKFDGVLEVKVRFTLRGAAIAEVLGERVDDTVI